MTPETILVYSKEEKIGDGFVKLPFVRALRQSFPEARITWLCGCGPTCYASTLKDVVAPFLDEVVERAGVGTGAAELVRLRRPLAGRRFDLILDTQKTFYRALILRRIPHRTFLSRAAGFRLSDVRPPPGHALPEHLPHSLIAMLGLVRPGTTVEAEPPALIDAETRAAARHLLPDGPTYVGFVPGSGTKVRCWPLDRYIAVAREQAALGRVPVFLIGPEEDPAWPARLREAVPGALVPEWDRDDPFRHVAGPLLVVALGERLAGAVANNCGTAAMLAAAGTPLVSIFGETSAEKYAPTTPRLRVVDAKDFGGPEVERIPVESVSAALARLLAEGGDA